MMIRRMRTGLVMGCLLVLVTGSTAQPLMELKDFFDIVSKSPVIYDYQVARQPITTGRSHTRLNYNHQWLYDSAGVRAVKPHHISISALSLAELGWQAYMADEPETALEMFQEVLDSFPLYTPVMSQMGEVLKREGRFDEAIYWFRRAIAVNPIDYVAAWNLGLVLDEVGKHDSAITMMLYAWILNRNHPAIKRDVDRVVTNAGKEFKDWEFIPQYELEFTRGKVVLRYQEAWLGYAICQAVWAFEPGFAQSRAIESDYSMFRERECLACLVGTMTPGDRRTVKAPELEGFATALRNRNSFEFIIFEILLPEKPDMAFILGADRMERVIQYLKNVRM